MQDRQLIISCEHAGNEVPAEWRHLFEGCGPVLQSHRGWDIGAQELAKTLSSRFGSELYIHTITRLLVDANRSLHNPSAFSEFTDEVSESGRRQIIKKYYRPHRRKVMQEIARVVKGGGAVLHLSIHTFTPVFSGEKRNVDIAFLYDPQRSAEKKICREWRRHLQRRLRQLKYRMNYPYRGVMDGLTAALRKKYNQESYVGIELEVNQKFAELSNQKRWLHIEQEITGSLEDTLGDK